jgi:hypothetical protein
MLQSEPVLAVLSNLDSWDFNIFELDRASGHHPIVMIVLAYVIRLDLDLQLPIDVNNLVRFALALEAGYKHVPFHNMVHAADVVVAHTPQGLGSPDLMTPGKKLVWQTPQAG